MLTAGHGQIIQIGFFGNLNFMLDRSPFCWHQNPSFEHIPAPSGLRRCSSITWRISSWLAPQRFEPDLSSFLQKKRLEAVLLAAIWHKSVSNPLTSPSETKSNTWIPRCSPAWNLHEKRLNDHVTNRIFQDSIVTLGIV